MQHQKAYLAAAFQLMAQMSRRLLQTVMYPAQTTDLCGHVYVACCVQQDHRNTAVQATAGTMYRQFYASGHS